MATSLPDPQRIPAAAGSCEDASSVGAVPGHPGIGDRDPALLARLPGPAALQQAPQRGDHYSGGRPQNDRYATVSANATGGERHQFSLLLQAFLVFAFLGLLVKDELVV